MKRVLKIMAVSTALAMLALSGLPANAAEVLYRWKDDQGNPVHSDRPPPQGIDYEVISTGSSMVRTVEAEEGAVPLEVKPSASNDFEPVEIKKTKIEKNPEYCQRARENLATLDSNVRIRMRNDQGEVRFLTEEERDIERQKAHISMENYCEN